MTIATAMSFMITPVQASTPAAKANRTGVVTVKQNSMIGSKKPLLLSATCLQGSIEISSSSTLLSDQNALIRSNTPFLTATDLTPTDWQVSDIHLTGESFLDNGCIQTSR